MDELLNIRMGYSEPVVGFTVFNKDFNILRGIFLNENDHKSLLALEYIRNFYDCRYTGSFENSETWNPFAHLEKRLKELEKEGKII